MNMRRVGLCGGWLSVRGGGATSSALQQADVWRLLGYEVILFGVDDHLHAAPRLPTGQCLSIVLCPGVGGDAMLQSSGLLRRFHEVLPSLDLVHLNGPWRGLNRKLAQACRMRGVPVVLSPRGCCDPSARVFSEAVSAKRARVCDHALLSDVDIVHVTSHRERIQSIWSKEPKCFVNIPNPVNLNSFAPPSPSERLAARCSLGLAPGQRVLLHLGRVVPEKNPEFLLDLVRCLGDPATVLVMAGSVTAAMHSTLTEYAAAAGVLSQVCLVGPVQDDLRRAWAVAADVHLVPSHGENFCLSLVEAVSLGTPVVCSPNVGALEFLRSSAVNVVPLDIPAWCDAVRAALCEEPLKDALQRHIEIRRQFSPQRIAALWETSLRQLGIVDIGHVRD